MTARDLQQAIIQDLKVLFQLRRYTGSDGESVPINVYEHDVPERTSDDAPEPFPYIIVRLTGGNIETQTDPHKVSVMLLVGVYDADLNHKGCSTVVEILECIQEHYEGTPLLAGQFVFQDPFTWVTQDELSYPYYFGAANTTWSIPAPRRKVSELV